MSADDLRSAVAAALLLGGVALTLVAAVGLLRFPDLFSRMHAATKPQTLGLLLAVLGAAVALDDDSARARLLLVALFGFLTAPAAAHMVGRAGYGARSGAVADLVLDELASAPAGGDDRPAPAQYGGVSGPTLPGSGQPTPLAEPRQE